MPYYSDDEDIDVRIHRGRTSPFEYAPRPPIYQSRSGQLLEIASQRRGHSRSRSHDRRSPSPAPVIINNRIYNDHEDDYYEEEPRYLPVAIPQRHRSHSRPLPQSPPQGYMTREDYELERTRKELEKLKMEAQREEDEKRLKKELELRKLKEEKRVEEEKERAKLEAERAVKEWKAKEAEKERKAEEEKKRAKIEAELAIKEWKAKELEKKEKERKEKEEREKEYQHRLTDDLRRNGMDDRQIAIILKKDRDGAKDATRPTYTRLARRYLSLETLNVNRIDYTIDTVWPACSPQYGYETDE